MQIILYNILQKLHACLFYTTIIRANTRVEPAVTLHFFLKIVVYIFIICIYVSRTVYYRSQSRLIRINPNEIRLREYIVHLSNRPDCLLHSTQDTHSNT